MTAFDPFWTSGVVQLRLDLRVGPEQLISPAIERAVYDGVLQKKVVGLFGSTRLDRLDVADGPGKHLQLGGVLK